MRTATALTALFLLGCGICPGQENKAPRARLDPQAPWGEAVEGLRCRLEPDRAVWKVDEVPSLRLHVRNQGKRDLVIHMSQSACKVEVDGTWFDWAAPVSIPAGTWPAGGKYEDFEVRVTLAAPWASAGKPIALNPGKHKIRVAYETLDRKRPVRVVSQAVEIRAGAPDAPPDALIGYTEHRTDLPGGRHANVKTRRAVVVQADGTGRRVLAEELTREAGYSTQFVGWSPDGKAARVSRYWKSDEVGKWEEEHKTFRPGGDGVRQEMYLVDVAGGKATKQPPAEEKAKSALIKNLVHGRSLSPDGKRCAFEDPAYRLFLADADGSNAQQIKTGLRFHLMPSWSPDGAWVLFVAGEHYDCHPHVIKADGTGLKKLAGRNGYRGVIDFLDVYDFHDGSSDLPVWAPDSKAVFYTAKVGPNVELFRVTLDGKSERLTETPAGSMHYHSAPSPDGKWLAYGSKRDGVRQLYVMRLSDRREWRITDLTRGRAAMWPHWQPRATR